jgi:hypothetical protein
MGKVKKKLTPAQKRAKKKAKEERQKKYMWAFENGKQVRVKRPETIDGLDPDEFIRLNADPIWTHQNEMWECMEPEEAKLGLLEMADYSPYINNFCGTWKDTEGNRLFIEPIDERQVYVTFMKAGEDKPMLRPWLDNQPAYKMVGHYDPTWSPALDVELSNKGSGYCLCLDFHFEEGNYNTISPSIIRNERDSHLDLYNHLFHPLSPYSRQI